MSKSAAASKPFLKKTSTWVLIGIFALIGFVAANGDFSRFSPEVVAFKEKQLTTLTLDGFRAELAQAKDRPVLLLLYASWCPYCKQQIVRLKALKMLYPDDRLRILYVSTDADPYAASAFLLSKSQEDQLTPFHIPADDKTDLREALVKEFGLSEGNSIPHMALFDKNHRFSREFIGLTEPRDLLDGVKPLL